MGIDECGLVLEATQRDGSNFAHEHSSLYIFSLYLQKVCVLALFSQNCNYFALSDQHEDKVRIMETHKLLQQYTVHKRFFETATCANGCKQSAGANCSFAWYM